MGGPLDPKPAEIARTINWQSPRGMPDFLVLGPPKAGTSSLDAVLRKHPSVFMSPIKEPKYFLGRPPKTGGPNDNQTFGNYVWRRRDYTRLFVSADRSQLRGEATPHYLSSQGAHAHLRLEVPNARLIAVLRDPGKRAYSHWRYLVSNGQETVQNFQEACSLGPERILAGWAPEWDYLGMGNYADHLDSLYTHFRPSSVLTVKYENLIRDPIAELQAVWTFLGIDDLHLALPWENQTPEVLGGTRGRVLAQALRAGFAVRDWIPSPIRHAVARQLYSLYRRPDDASPARRKPADEDAAWLGEYYRPQVLRLREKYGFDVSGWLGT